MAFMMTSAPQQTLKRPGWVDTPQSLENMVRDLLRYPRLAVDTESNSLYVYREQVCLIQFSTGEADYLVDTLRLRDLSALAPIFADGKIEKIFHAAEYDVICLRRDFGFQFTNLFDTMLASRILGREAVGLAAMLEEAFGIELDKHYQRANWGMRPLPPELLSYARLDTHYLIDLRDRLYEELLERGRLDLALEDFRRMTLASAAPENGNGRVEGRIGADCYKLSGARDLTPVQLAVLQSLCDYREKQAQRVNLPVFKVMGHDMLVSLAASLPTTRDELFEVKGVSRRLLERHAEGLLEAIGSGLRVEGGLRPPPHPARPSEQYLARADALRTWRKETGARLGVPSDVILPKDIVERLSQARPANLNDLRQAMFDVPWRFEQFGPQILDLIQEGK